LRARTSDQFVSQPASALERLLPQGGHFFAAEPAKKFSVLGPEAEGAARAF
jgi:hypothetical protein